MAADDGESSASFLFKLLAVSRYAVVSVVTAVAVVVIVKTMSAVRRPEALRLVVTRGALEVDRIPVMPPTNVTFLFTLSAYNPGDNDIAYTNISVGLFASTSTSVKADISEFTLPASIRVPSHVPRDASVKVSLTPVEDVPMEYVWTVYDGNLVGTAMRIDGDLVLVTSPQSRTRRVTYYCWPLTFGYDPGSNDVSCFQGFP